MRRCDMRAEIAGYRVDALSIVTSDHLLSALAQLDFFDQETLAGLHAWCEAQIEQHADEPLQRAVFEAYNKLVCALITENI